MSNRSDFKQLSGPSSRYKLWLGQAGFDLQASEASLNDKMFEWACYQAVQSVEKSLKSVIVHAGWRPPQTHKLGVLVGISNDANTLFKNVKFDFRKIEAYTFISRYPFVFPGEANLTPHELITKEDAVTCVAIAKDIYNKVEQFIGQNMIQKGVMNLDHYYYSEEQVKTRIDSIVAQLKNSNELKPQKIIVFGSFAREQAKPKTSTMDILIVAETTMNFVQRIEYVRDLTKEEVPIIEPLVYTPEEFNYMINEQNEGFLESALDEGKVVFDSKQTSAVSPQTSAA